MSEEEFPEIKVFCDKIITHLTAFIEKESVSGGGFENYIQTGRVNCCIPNEEIFGKRPNWTWKELIINQLWRGSLFNNKEEEKFYYNYFNTVQTMDKKIEKGLTINAFKITFQNYDNFKGTIVYGIEW